MSPDSVLHRLQRVLKRADLPRIRFHDLRYTFATLVLQNGVDAKTVSSMSDHYSTDFTPDTYAYAHVTTDALCSLDFAKNRQWQVKGKAPKRCRWRMQRGAFEEAAGELRANASKATYAATVESPCAFWGF